MDNINEEREKNATVSATSAKKKRKGMLLWKENVVVSEDNCSSDIVSYMLINVAKRTLAHCSWQLKKYIGTNIGYESNPYQIASDSSLEGNDDTELDDQDDKAKDGIWNPIHRLIPMTDNEDDDHSDAN